MAPTVGAALVRRGEVLLGLRSSHKSFAGCWDLIGGHIEYGECELSALRRELHEELGIVPIAPDYLATLTIDCRAGPSALHVFAVRSWRGILRVRNDEHVAVRWFDLGEAASIPNLVTPAYRSIFMSLQQSS